MDTSESIKNIMPALLAVQKAVGPVSKNAKNTFHNSKYATLESVIDACYDSLHANGIVNIQTFDDSNISAGELVIVTRLYHAESGEWIGSRMRLDVKQNKDGSYDPQGHGSAATYGRRYSLMAILGMVAEDDDASKASGYNNQRQKSATGRAVAPASNGAVTNLEAARKSKAQDERNLSLVAANKILALQKQYSLSNEDVLTRGGIAGIKIMVDECRYDELNAAYKNLCDYARTIKQDAQQPEEVSQEEPKKEFTCTACSAVVPESVVSYCLGSGREINCYSCQKKALNTVVSN